MKSLSCEREPLGFWSQYLQDAQPNEYPLFPRHAYIAAIDEETTRQVQLGDCSRAGKNIPRVLLSAWAALLSLYSSTDEVIYGVSGFLDLDDPESNYMVPMRLKVQRQQRIDSLHGQIQKLQQCFQHNRLARPCDLEALGPSLQGALQYRSAVRLNAGETRRLPDTSIHLAILVDIILDDNSLRTVIRFDSRCIDTRQANRLLGQFHHLVLLQQQTSLAGNIRSADLLNPQDAAELSSKFHRVPDNSNTTVQDVFTAKAMEQPHSLAVQSWDGDLSYDQLERLSSDASAVLMAHDVRHGDVVALALKKGKDAIIAMLAVAKAGATCAMVDPRVPEERLRYIVGETNAKVMLGSARGCGVDGIPHFTVTDVLSRVDGLSPSQRKSKARTAGKDTLCIIFTSGSSGHPKGCYISHQAMTSMAANYADKVYMTNESRVLHYASYSFVGGVAELAIAFQAGACLCVPDRRNSQFPANIEKVINNMRITWADISASMATIMRPSAVPTLETLLLTGEPMTKVDVETWAPTVRLMNSYGATETCSAFLCSDGRMKRESDPNNIGRPFAGRTWIVDEDDSEILMPIGAIGELLLEGPGLASGYLNNPDRTSSTFIPSPSWIQRLGLQSESRLYKSGDLARYDSDGSVILLGRKDTQVKIRGQRLEVGEIEYHVRHLLHDTEVAVDAIAPRNTSRKVLVAFLNSKSSDSGGDLDPSSAEVAQNSAELRQKLARHLPEYMIPLVFLYLNTFPTTLSKKLDRRRLRIFASTLDAERLFGSRVPGNNQELTPLTDVETRLKMLWETALGRSLPSVDSTSNFFRLGGDSLSVAKLAQLCGIDGNPAIFASLFANSTLAEQSRAIQSVDSQIEHKLTTVSATPPQDPVLKQLQSRYGPEVDFVSRTSDFQASIIAGEISRAKTERHFFTLTFNPTVSRSLLQTRLLGFVNSHAALRSVFRVEGSSAYQLVLRAAQSTDVFSIVDKKFAWPSANWVDDWSLRPIHFALTMVDDCVSQLTMSVSHAVFDGAFFTKFCEELSTPASGPTAPLDFRTFHQPNVDNSDDASYWSQLLHNAPYSQLVARTRPSIQDPMDSLVRYKAHLPDWRGLDFTLATILNAAWGLVLSSTLQSEDVVFGTYVAKRNIGEVAARSVVGCSLEVVPLRITLNHSTNSTQLLQSVRAQFADSMAHMSMGEATFIEKCTQWPRWSRLSTLLLHKNESDYQSEQRSLTPFYSDYLGSHCRGELDDALGDYSDLEIITLPNSKDQTIEFQLYHNKQAIPETEVYTLAQLFTESVRTLISTHAETEPIKRKGPGKTRFPLPEPIHNVPILEAVGLSGSETWTQKMKIVKETWESVFGLRDWDLEAPFWDFAHLVSAYSLSREYRRRDFNVSMDDMFECPSMSAQVGLLLSRIQSQRCPGLMAVTVTE